MYAELKILEPQLFVSPKLLLVHFLYFLSLGRPNDQSQSCNSHSLEPYCFYLSSQKNNTRLFQTAVPDFSFGSETTSLSIHISFYISSSPQSVGCQWPLVFAYEAYPCQRVCDESIPHVCACVCVMLCHSCCEDYS